MNSFQDMCVETAEVNHRSQRSAPGASHLSNRVWLVDDDEELRPLLAGLLARVEGIGCCREFALPQGLLSALRPETAPDLILLDVHFGAQNGIDFIQPIKALAPATRVVMMSVFCDLLEASRALQAGASGYLLKVAVPEQILAHLPGGRLPAQPRLDPTLGFRGPPRLRAR